jgi:hypothetical protein
MFLLGDQSVSKFNESDAARNAVSIYLALVRLPTHGTDAVITFNCPTAISHASSSAGTCRYFTAIFVERFSSS